MTCGEGEQESVHCDTELWRAEAQPNNSKLQAQASALTVELCRLVGATAWLMDALSASRGLLDAHWCVAAGAVRSVVWNQLHGFERSAPPEIDLVHFTPATGPEFDAEVAAALTRRAPRFRWDVVNQVHAHRFAVNPNATPFTSLDHAMACWPETATAVGISLTSDGELQVVAPHGLTDLFGLVLRRSPLLRDPEVFEQRVVAKRFCERWPLLRIV